MIPPNPEEMPHSGRLAMHFPGLGWIFITVNAEDKELLNILGHTLVKFTSQCIMELLKLEREDAVMQAMEIIKGEENGT